MRAIPSLGEGVSVTLHPARRTHERTRSLRVRGPAGFLAAHGARGHGQNAAPDDTLAAYQKMVALRDSVIQGEDFGDLAVRNSEDPSARNPQAKLGYRGHLGIFSAGRMVKPFEDRAYSTPIGEVSEIFRTKFGYHLIYVHDRFAKIPDIRISHIVIRPKGTTAADSAQAMELSPTSPPEWNTRPPPSAER